MRSQKVILLLGGNQGNVIEHFRKCTAYLGKQVGPVYAMSRVYSTKAWGPVSQPDFLNMAVGVHTAMPPGYLLSVLLGLEKQFGRKREIKYGPRTLDIDILFYGHEVILKPGLHVPHPEIQNRRFALVPASEITGNYKHPVYQKTLAELLRECKDTLEVTLWKA